MKKKIFVLLFLLLIDIGIVEAKCSYSTISRAKSLVGNINLSYNYHIIDSEPYFDVTINNITPDMYFVDSQTDITYRYSDTRNGELTIYNYNGVAGVYKFYSTNSECNGVSLGSKYYKLPVYNIYYNSAMCSDIPDYSLCKKWVDFNYSYDEFSTAIDKYKMSLIEKGETEENVVYNKNIFWEIVKFYIKYYYYILLGLIIVCGLIIVIKRKKDKII